MKSQIKNINVEVDWDELDTFWADQYKADYGKHFSTTPDASSSDIVIFKSKESLTTQLLFNQLIQIFFFQALIDTVHDN